MRWTLFTITLFANASFGLILRVPDQFPDIQLALDSVSVDDTVMVERGLYEEILTAPSVPFVFLGEFVPDSTGMPRPLVDASAIPGPDSTAVLTLPLGCVARIDGMSFKNENRIGIELWSDSLFLSNCVVESTSFGIDQRRFDVSALIDIRDSRFSQCTEMCILSVRGNYLRLSRCDFIGGTEANIYSLVAAWYADIDSCVFACPSERTCLTTSGTSSVRHCAFGPCTAPAFTYCVRLVGDSVECLNNRFVDCASGWHSLVVSSPIPEGIEVRGNSFLSCRSRSDLTVCEGALGIGVAQDENGDGPLIESNVFANCSGHDGADDIMPPINSPVRLRSNRFVHDSLNGLPSIGGSGSPWQSTPVTLRNNTFEECGYALDGSAETDARENWWGDASGPYHETLNPTGLGDTITGPVQFIPWLTDTTQSISDYRATMPDDFALIAYPNPFNPLTKLTFSLERTAHVDLTIFDVTGRQVANLIDDNLPEGKHEVFFNGASLASAVYFARLATPSRSITSRIVLIK